MIAIGIDPGISGGMAYVSTKLDPRVEPMRATPADNWEIFQEMTGAGDCVNERIFIGLEKVGGMPGQGIASTWKFAQNYGMLIGMLAAAELPYDLIRPVDWQTVFHLKKRKGETITQKKNRHKDKAQRLFPGLRITHMTADALLIAEYVRRVNNG